LKAVVVVVAVAAAAASAVAAASQIHKIAMSVIYHCL
jgi:hypothetical protein